MILGMKSSSLYSEEVKGCIGRGFGSVMSCGRAKKRWKFRLKEDPLVGSYWQSIARDSSGLMEKGRLSLMLSKTVTRGILEGIKEKQVGVV